MSESFPPDYRWLRVSATCRGGALSSWTMAMITAAARTIYPYDASLDDVDERAREQHDRATREDLAASVTIEDAVVFFAPGQRRHLR